MLLCHNEFRKFTLKLNHQNSNIGEKSNYQKSNICEMAKCLHLVLPNHCYWHFASYPFTWTFWRSSWTYTKPSSNRTLSFLTHSYYNHSEYQQHSWPRLQICIYGQLQISKQEVYYNKIKTKTYNHMPYLTQFFYCVYIKVCGVWL